MNWEDESYLLSKTKFRENANIINIFSLKRGKVNGIVYGGNSRKIRNYLQIGNKIFVIHSSKNDNKIGYFKTELISPVTPLYFDDKERSAALISLCSLLNILLPDSQPNKKIYNSFENLISSINLDNWIVLYIFFELNLIKDLGFDVNLKEFISNKDESSKIKKVKIDGNTYDVPYYLISKKPPDIISKELIRRSLYFTRNIIMNKFFLPNNLSFPRYRVILENFYR